LGDEESDMPQPYTPLEGAKLERGYRILEKRPACAIKIALVGAAWSDVEFFLVLAAGQATATVHYVEPDGRAGGQAGAVAWATINALESLNAKVSVIRAILGVSITPALCEEFEALVPAIRKAAGMRNDIVHCGWNISDAYPHDILSPTGKTPRYLRYREGDLEAIATRIASVADRVNAFSGRCFGHHVDQERRKAGLPLRT